MSKFQTILEIYHENAMKLMVVRETVPLECNQIVMELSYLIEF
jgi:hypothetical protein